MCRGTGRRLVSVLLLALLSLSWLPAQSSDYSQISQAELSALLIEWSDELATYTKQLQRLQESSSERIDSYDRRLQGAQSQLAEAEKILNRLRKSYAKQIERLNSAERSSKDSAETIVRLTSQSQELETLVADLERSVRRLRLWMIVEGVVVFLAGVGAGVAGVKVYEAFR